MQTRGGKRRKRSKRDKTENNIILNKKKLQ